jgi:hypothetical protein
MKILSGRITCAMQTSFTDVYTSGGGTSLTTYNDRQFLSWSWTNTPPPLVSSSPQVFSALWGAQGSGFKRVHQEATSPTGQVHTQDMNNTWTMNCQAMVQFQVRQTTRGFELTSQETYPPNGYTMVQIVVVDNIQQGPPTISSGPAIALAVSIIWGASVTDVLNTLDPIAVASPPPPPRFLGGLRTSRPGAPVVRGSRQDELTARGPDAPLGKYKTTANWSWEITTQP